MQEYTFYCRRVMEGSISFETDNPHREVDNFNFPFEEVDWAITTEEVTDFAEVELDHDAHAEKLERGELAGDLADVLEDLMSDEGGEPRSRPESREIWERARNLIKRARG